LFTAGDHVPEILFVLVPGKLKASPLQISAIGENVGIVFAGLIDTTIFSSAVTVQIELLTIAVTVTLPFNILGL